jgi:hypothetical protein
MSPDGPGHFALHSNVLARNHAGHFASRANHNLHRFNIAIKLAVDLQHASSCNLQAFAQNSKVVAND